MRFLAKFAQRGGRFLGQVHKGARFISAVAPQVGRAAQSVANVAANPALEKYGVAPSLLRGIHKGAEFVGGATKLIPSVQGHIQQAAGVIQNAQTVAGGVKRTLGDLYNMAK